MLKLCANRVVRRLSLLLVGGAMAVCPTLGMTQPMAGGSVAADALLAIDQHRVSVVERIVDTWGAALAKSSALVPIDELRTRLLSLRADQLLVASLAGTLDGVRAIIGADTTQASKPGLQQLKALGDSALDVVYTPVTPCRLVETRGTFAAVYQGNGTPAHTPAPFAPNEIRSYAVQGGNGVCLTQLPGGLNPSAVQLQVFGLPTTTASGDIEILPQGAAFGSTATMVYIGSIAFNTVSTNAKINLANHQISVQVRGGGANLAIDVVGYFAAPSGNGGKFFMQGGNAFGAAAHLGTTDNQPLELYVNNQRGLRIDPNATAPNLFGGYASNGAYAGTVGVTVGGGGAPGAQNTQLGALSCLKAFGCINGILDSFGTISGGAGNLAGAGTVGVDGTFATVGGGISNWAYRLASTVSGGYVNTASGESSTVGGGSSNTASGDNSTVAGGNANGASGAYSTVAGGQANAAQANYATIGGGISNVAGKLGTVAGGTTNHAEGEGSAVPGGARNNASGLYSFAAGFQANALADGMFVWSDTASIFPFIPSISPPGWSNPANTFNVRATGGIWFVTGVNGSGTPTWGCTLTNGAGLFCASDRNLKRNLVRLDGTRVLAKLVAMPLYEWQPKDGPNADDRHIGPMAQDFYATFGFGHTDKAIGFQDVDGVALAAIQGLHQLSQEKDAKIEAQQQAIVEQRREIADLRERMSDVRNELDAVKRALSQLTGADGRVAMHGTP